MEGKRLKKAISTAMETGMIMLQNGAETYRVEETITRMISSKTTSNVEVFVMSTGIILGTEIDGEPYTTVARVPSIGLDLETIARANFFSRIFTQGEMTDEETDIILKELKSPPKFSKPIRYAFSGMAGGFFVLMFGGSFVEFVLAYIASSLTVFSMDKLAELNLNFFVKNILGGLLSALSSIFLVFLMGLLSIGADFNTVIIGPLMTLVPGVSLTNGIRDLMSGELIAGTTKMMEALFIAIALAFGGGIVLQVIIAFVLCTRYLPKGTYPRVPKGTFPLGTLCSFCFSYNCSAYSCKSGYLPV